MNLIFSASIAYMKNQNEKSYGFNDNAIPKSLNPVAITQNIS
jgi:hypothetical protein